VAEARQQMLARLGWRAVDAPQRPVLFVNPRSGGGKAIGAGLPEQARQRGIEPIVLGPDDDLAALVAEAVARGADALGMAGGDGSLAVVAVAARDHGLPFVCVPAGTRNHFALDLGVARHDLVGALDGLCDGLERRIDVAEVNGRLFLNNVSLGIYGDAVQNPGYRQAKLRMLLETADEVRGPAGALPSLRLVDDRGREHRDPAVVLVSNNPYALERSLAPGTRPSLDSGRLGILVLHGPGTSLRDAGHAWSAPSLEAHATAPVNAGVDGEAITLDPPLHFTSRPGALRVRISASHPGASPSALLTPRSGRE
jgi:diacylglycerol kinase family enzyme